MRMITSFFSGAICGALVGAAAALLLTPASGDDLQEQIRTRIQSAIDEGRSEMARTEATLATQYENLKRGGTASV